MHFRFVIAILVSSSAACDQCKPPVMLEASIAPRFFCDGDKVAFTIRTENVDNLRLVGNQVDISFPANGGTIERPTFYSESPFDFWGDIQGHDDAALSKVPEAAIVLAGLPELMLQVNSLNNDTWKPKLGPEAAEASVQFLADRNVVNAGSEECECVQGRMPPCIVTETRYEQWAEADTYTFRLFPEDFGSKSRLIGVADCAPLPSPIAISGPFGNVQIDPSTNPSREVLLTNNKRPWGIYTVKLHQKIQVKVADVTDFGPPEMCFQQKGRQTTPNCALSGKTSCSEVVQRLCLRLYVRCDP